MKDFTISNPSSLSSVLEELEDAVNDLKQSIDQTSLNQQSFEKEEDSLTEEISTLQDKYDVLVEKVKNTLQGLDLTIDQLEKMMGTEHVSS